MRNLKQKLTKINIKKDTNQTSQNNKYKNRQFGNNRSYSQRYSNNKSFSPQIKKRNWKIKNDETEYVEEENQVKQSEETITEKIQNDVSDGEEEVTLPSTFKNIEVVSSSFGYNKETKSEVEQKNENSDSGEENQDKNLDENRNQGYHNTREQFNYPGYPVYGFNEGGDQRIFFDPNYYQIGMQVPEEFQDKENVQNDKKFSGDNTEGNHGNMMHGYPYPIPGYHYNYFPPPYMPNSGYPNSVPQPGHPLPYRFPNPYRTPYPPYDLSHVRGQNNERNNNQEEYNMPPGNYFQFLRVPQYNSQ